MGEIHNLTGFKNLSGLTLHSQKKSERFLTKMKHNISNGFHSQKKKNNNRSANQKFEKEW